jgi:predicted TIM-barrel fold metal-dependent hydrolase
MKSKSIEAGRAREFAPAVFVVLWLTPLLSLAQTPGAGKLADTLLLKDFKPRPVLRLPAHEVPKARFPVIDVHNHVNDAHGGGDRLPPARVVEIMDRCNVKKIVILTGKWGEQLQGVIDRMVKPYPDRFAVFTEIDWSRFDEPDFGEAMAAQIWEAVARGARGLKITKDLGLENKDKSGKLIAVDDPRLDPIWAECGRQGIPVAIHVTDPDAFFLPVDNTNERIDELGQFPGWSFFGPQFPSKDMILEAQYRVFARHPRTRFIALHFGNLPERLDDLEPVLDRYPNVAVEFGARHAELGRQPRRARQFFLKYQDRILFGTDFQVSEAMYRNYFRWLETEDEYFDYWESPGQGRWRIYGIGLPDKVLEKVYFRNAERVLAQRR